MRWAPPARVDAHLRVVGGNALPEPGGGGHVDPAEAAIQPQEITFAATLFRLIPTPRAGRRFSGTYRQIKASVAPAQLPQFEGSDGCSGEYQVPMLLLAIRIGASAAAERLFPALRDAVVQGRDLRDRLYYCADIAPDLASLTMVEQIIQPIVADPSFPLSPALFRLWLPRIERYTFDMTGAPRCSWLPPQDRVAPGWAPLRLSR